jgi:hypothetical protein
MLLVLVIVTAAIGLALLVRPVRRLIHSVVVPNVEKVARDLREALQDPARLSLSFLGSLLLNLGYIAALFASSAPSTTRSPSPSPEPSTSSAAPWPRPRRHPAGSAPWRPP